MIDPLAAGIVAGLTILVLVFAVESVRRKRPKELDPQYFQAKWKEAQGHLRAKESWPLAVISADNLLDEALKRRRFKGKTMGERLVAAQHELTDNDGVWFAHKMRNRLVHETDVKLKQADVKKALIGIRQALKDLGASIR
jgi:hypothetical protein